MRAADRAAAGGVSNSRAIAYTLIMLLAIAPGVYLRWGSEIEALAPLRELLAPLKAALADIEFGAGLRFWLGVAGAAMVGLLLLYPLRKAMAAKRGLGSIGGWFHLHIVLGLAGPALILYHCDFGLGGTNANVALWTMLAIAVSGLLGQFVYRRVSAGFYGDKVQAEEHLAAIRRLLREVDGLERTKQRLLEELDELHARLLAPRQGIIHGLRNRLSIEERRIYFARELHMVVREGARAANWPLDRYRSIAAGVEVHLGGYVSMARSGAGRAVREQMWSAWRLFHMPLFLVMTAATILHVIAVWDFGPTEPREDMPVHEAAASPKAGPNAAQRPPVQQLAVRTSRVEVQSAAGTLSEKPVSEPLPPPSRQAAIEPSKIPAAVAAAKPDAARPNPIGDLIGRLPETPAPDASAPINPPAPAPAKRRPPPPEATAPPPVPTTPAAPSRPAVVAEKAAPPPPPAPKSAVVAAPAPAAPPAAPPAVAQKREPPTAAKDPLYAELERRTESEGPMMGLGLKDRGLADQIRFLKEHKTAGKFSHSEAETGFPLIGKHVKVDCADCHKQPLRETRQATQRQCIDCHKQDDVHRGRRPDCAQCHVPTRWSEVRRKRK